MGIKMIVSDLDGTLFNSDEEGYIISAKLVSAIDAFKKRGNIFTIATGRPEETSSGVAKSLGVNSPYIVNNGAKIIDESGRTIYSETFPLMIWLPFLEKLQEKGASIVFTQNGKVFCLKYTKRIIAYEKKELVTCHPIKRELLNPNTTVNKILIMGSIAAYQKEWIALDESFKSSFRYVISEDDYMEIIKKEVSKGSALKKLKDYLGIQDDEVLTIGNHLNDKELIEEGHIGIAVANAAEELKSVANFVTCGAYEEGVIEVIQKFV